MSISKIFVPNFVSVLTNKRHIEHNFHSVAGVIPQGWDLGLLGVKNFSMGICDGAPSTAPSSWFCHVMAHIYAIIMPADSDSGMTLNTYAISSDLI